MSEFVVYNNKGKILRTGSCPKFLIQAQAHEGEFVFEGNADDSLQKMVAGKVVDKTQIEIDAEKPIAVPIPEDEKPAIITNKQWRDIQNRIATLEAVTGWSR